MYHPCHFQLRAHNAGVGPRHGGDSSDIFVIIGDNKRRNKAANSRAGVGVGGGVVWVMCTPPGKDNEWEYFPTLCRFDNPDHVLSIRTRHK